MFSEVNGSAAAPPIAAPATGIVPIDPETVRAVLQSLVAQASGVATNDPRDNKTVHEVIELYLHHARADLEPRSYHDASKVLERFDRACGTLTVAKCRAFDLRQWLDEKWRAAANWTVRRVIATVKRVFNWALDAELIDKNPFARVRHRGRGRRGRPMSQEDFQTIMRASSPSFRRFLVFLKFTGCRPGEAGMMKWSDVRFDQGCVVLENHKTAKKTERPRRIPIVPTAVKLLLWIRRHKQVSVRELLYQILKDGPVNAATVAKRLKAYGVSYHAVQRARKALKVKKIRGGGRGSRSRYLYTLSDLSNLPRATQWDYVFLNHSGNPWCRSALACQMLRIRRRTGLPKTVKLYGLRHRYGTEGIRNKVNLKLLSMNMGHKTTTMTEYYVDEGGLDDELLAAAMQIVYGPGAIATLPAAPSRPIPTVAVPGTIEEIQPIVEQLASRHGLSAPRPSVPIAPADGAGNGTQLQYLFQALLQRLADPPRASRRPRTPDVMPAEPTPAQRNAHEAYRAAIEKKPGLAAGTDVEAFAWMQKRPEFARRLPRSVETFTRYLRLARNALEGAGKRQQRREQSGQPTAPAEK
jgi:integrase